MGCGKKALQSNGRADVGSVDLWSHLAPNIWNVLRGQVFIHPLPLLSGGRSSVGTTGM